MLEKKNVFTNIMESFCRYSRCMANFLIKATNLTNSTKQTNEPQVIIRCNSILD